ncbi:hypothetical protein D3C83_150700 [compost metagenome]
MSPPWTPVNSVMNERPFHWKVELSAKLRSGFTSPICTTLLPASSYHLRGFSATVPIADWST